MKIEITSWLTGKVIFECEAESMRLGVELAVTKGVSLEYADLRAADLSDADLRAANLRAADLSDADLRAADLRDADLRAANLRAADLRAANLRAIRDDFYAVLSQAPAEVPALIAALDAGRVNGSAYSDGECGCLVGTLAIAAGADPKDSEACSAVHGLEGNSSRPAECFFLSINKGDTPRTSQHAKLARDWAAVWLDRMQSAFGAKEPIIA